jgi:hypothetical protein
MSATPGVPPDVPVFVDAVIASEDFPIVRCSYLTLEIEEPAPNVQVSLAVFATPMSPLLLALWAVVRQPVHATHFTRPGHFAELFDRVESTPGWSIETNDLWLPSDLFRARVPAPGEVYRLGTRLFAIAVRFRHGAMERNRFVAIAHDLVRDLSPSPAETDAFQQWHAEVLSREPIGKDPDFALSDGGAA